MQSKNTNFLRQNKNILRLALGVLLILLVPLAAMQFSDSVDWSWFDFAAAGTLLFGAGLAFELVTRDRGGFMYRAAMALALGTALLLVWVNLAVGIIGSEDNPANGLYLGVLAVGLLGGLAARLRPGGMLYAMAATALAQAGVTAIALRVVNGVDLPQALMVNGFFITLWAASAILFWHASSDQRGQRPE